METILDNLVGSIVNKVQDAIIDEGIMILGVEEDLKELQRIMNQVQCFLKDAEQRRTEESAVNNWLSELKEAAYKADDIMDLAKLEGDKLLVDEDEASLSSCSAIFIILQRLNFLPYIQRRHEIAIQIRNLNSELEKISKLGEIFLKLHNVQTKDEASIVRRLKTCELLEPNLVGNETLLACTKLVELILRHKDKKSYKIGIVGTGGVGKTTLVQKIYNDVRMEGVFNKRAWVCVSPDYSEDVLLKQVLRNIEADYKEDETTGELSRKLAVAIENKTLFLVLDDLWQHEVWTNLLRKPLDAAAMTIILVTTRNETVAQGIGVEDLHQVELMSDRTGWELLWKCMNISEESEVQDLRAIGMDIIRMCGGLPLAIKAIASVLSTKEKTENEWRKFINKSAWSMTKLPNDLRGALYLSYDDLPIHLKQCFLYCTLYPEGQGMYCVDLIRFWVVEDFVEERDDQLIEDTAEEYYMELINRNLLQPDPIMGYVSCRMHDLLRRLAQHLLQDE
ncbi:hypothetical protein HU200_038498 [Digitaria exilis]|uniref:Disease resistance protein RGA3 n=1 Tax=Digitaria exilis TaxID=1010633 RepID=A0A835BCP4_9POAL|nr:hypothetical protein HU200_038498 [Digitaria exilis]